MTAFVVDASAALKWFFIDETDEASASLLRTLDADTAIVPSIWPLEMANGLMLAERVRRISAEDFSIALDRLSRLPIEIDTETARRALGETTSLAQRHRLTIYDAAYLELAARRSLPLATYDGEIVAAARKLRIELLI